MAGRCWPVVSLPHLSHSTLEDVRTCSLKVKLKKVDRVPTRPGWSLLGGNAVHAATEADDKRDCGLPVEPEEMDFDTVFSALIERQLLEHPEWTKADFYCAGRKSKEWPNKEDEKWWRENGPLMVERWRNFKRVTPWHIWITPNGDPAVEIELLGEWGGSPTKGYVDLVMETQTGQLVVVDKKTGANEPKSATQLAQYGGDIERIFPGVKVPYGAYWMGRTGSLTPPVDLAPLAKDLDEDYRKAKAIIEQDLFLASPGMLCGSCSVNAYCKSFSGPAVLPLPGPRVNI